MALESPPMADKFIVDRRKPHRNSDVARAVRKTRDRLSQQAGSPTFDREMLKIHARAILDSALALPLLVLVIAAAGLYAGADQRVVLWAVAASACYSGLYLLARRTDAKHVNDIQPAKLHRQFLVAHFV